MDKNGEAHPIISTEAVARVFKRLADILQGVATVTNTSMMTITPELSAHFLEVYVKKTEIQALNQTCIAVLCALAATPLIWRNTAFMARMSRYLSKYVIYIYWEYSLHISDIYIKYTYNIPVLFH
jgi:hypothetical protein